MHRIAAFSIVLWLLAGSDPDHHARDGMDAQVRGEWVAAVRAFERSLGRAPESVRLERLKAARAGGFAFWEKLAQTYVEHQSFRDAARAAGIARALSPESRRLPELLARIEKAGARIPVKPPVLPAPHPAYPARTLEAKLWALGGSPMREKAIESCLAFLVSSQSPGGSWNCAAYGGDGANTTGVTGLALLALLGDGSVAVDGRRGDAIRKAVDFLEKAQDEEGCLSARSEMHFIYRHSIATQALAEYAALARETERLGPVLEKAHDFLLRAQQPGKGWRYGMGGESDTSVTLWAVSALDRLRRAGIEVDDKGFRGAVAWIDDVTEPKDGTAGYTKRGTSSARLEKAIEKYPPEKTRALTAAARLIEAYAGRPAGPLQAKRMAQVRLLPPDQGCPDMYYWHLGARAFVAGEGMIPAVWWERLWFGVEGHRGSDGSVDPAGPWGGAGGRIYSTAICALSLMAPYAEPGPSFMKRASRFLEEGRRVVVVPADAHDLPTGIYLDKGMELEVEPRGEVISFKGVRATGPAGHKKALRGRKRLHSSSPYGCLLARVGRDGRFAALKKKGRFRAKACGQLFLSMNDERPVDATGQLTVELRLRR